MTNAVEHSQPHALFPKQISGTLEVLFPSHPKYQVSHETVYRAIYVMPESTAEPRKEPKMTTPSTSLINLSRMLVLALTLSVTPFSFSADFEVGVAAYEKGNFAAALKEWRPLAKQGNAAAQYNLGLMYDMGKGVPQDYKAAIKWYTLSAEQGNAFAQYSLGLMYWSGAGTIVDYVTAHMWLNIASSNGKDPEERNLLTKEMTAEQIHEAQTLAREWVKAHSK
jgi:hypothetical protein